MKSPPKDMSNDRITTLRVIQTWVFHETIIGCSPRKLKDEGGITVKLKPRSDKINEENLRQFLRENRHRCDLLGYCEVRQSTTFKNSDGLSEIVSILHEPSKEEQRFLSYAVEKGINLLWIAEDKYNALFVSTSLAGCDDFKAVLDMIKHVFSGTTNVVAQEPQTTRRGIGERPSGLWDIRVIEDDPKEHDKIFYRFSGNVPAYDDSTLLLRNWVDIYVKNHPKVKALFVNSNHTPNKQKFVCRSMNVQNEISQQDMKDLFSTSDGGTHKATTNADSQSLFFPLDFIPETKSKDSRCKFPLSKNTPEGYRLLMVLVAKRRGNISLQLPNANKNGDKEEDEEDDEANQISIYPDIATHSFSKWKRLEKNQTVVVSADCIQATASPSVGSPQLYACAANCLELKKRGDVKAEGLTILPQGPLFVLLCRMAFGLCQNERLDEEQLVNNGLDFVVSRTEASKICKDAERDWKRRIEMAIEFHESCKYQGEELRCFPDKVQALLEIFDGMDTYL